MYAQPCILLLVCSWINFRVYSDYKSDLPCSSGHSLLTRFDERWSERSFYLFVYLYVYLHSIGLTKIINLMMQDMDQNFDFDCIKW